MLIKMKKTVAVLGMAALITTGGFTVFAASNVKVIVNDTPVSFTDQQPVIQNGRTLVPVRGVFEQLGFNVSWDGTTATATLKNESDTVIVPVGEASFTANGKAITPDVPAQLINGRTMLPLRAICESLGSEVVWDGASQTAFIEYIAASDIAEQKELAVNTEPSIPSEPVVNPEPSIPSEPIVNPDSVSEPDTSTTAYTVPKAEEIYNRLMAMEKEYPTGTKWNNDNTYMFVAGMNSNIPTNCMGCAAFAAMLSDAAFGVDAPSTKHYDLDDIRVGDMVRINNDTHTVVVIAIDGDTVTIAEGNFSEQVKWGRTFEMDELIKKADFVVTRYK